MQNEVVVVPDRQSQVSFSETAKPLIELLQVLGTKNTNLRHTRDLLLPRLVSGEVDVSELDIALPEEAV